MTRTTEQAEPAYHLRLEREEVPVAASALRLYISDEAHQRRIRELARDVLSALEQAPDALGVLSVSLSAEHMKITHGAVRLLLNDLGREQAAEGATLGAILEKLPDGHSLRAIPSQ